MQLGREGLQAAAATKMAAEIWGQWLAHGEERSLSPRDPKPDHTMTPTPHGSFSSGYQRVPFSSQHEPWHEWDPADPILV